MKVTKEMLCKRIHKIGYKPAKAIQLNNCKTISVQAGEYNYSTPREDSTAYTHVELGFPTFDPPSYISEYAENSEALQDTIYSYVPIELVVKLLNEMGVNE